MATIVPSILCILQIALAIATPGQPWRDDLHFMAREMERVHKNLYHQVTREEFASMISSLDAKIPSLSRHQIIVEMAKIVAAVGDGHTNIAPARDPKIGFRTLAIALYFFEDGLFIRAAHRSESLAVYPEPRRRRRIYGEIREAIT